MPIKYIALRVKELELETYFEFHGHSGKRGHSKTTWTIPGG